MTHSLDLTPTAEELATRTDPVTDTLRAEYDELLRDKRTGIGVVPCYTWNGSCHCHEVPGNGWNGQPPHDESTAAGKPWCVAHQDWECDEAHPFVTFDEFCKRREG